MKNFDAIVIAGSSVTADEAWPTWATWFRKLSLNIAIHDVSVKGLGNEAIITKALHTAQQFDRPMIIIQLTSVDKWDWYVENHDLCDTMRRQKHTVTRLRDTDRHGYWSTGSHFPLWKEYYGQHYFGLEHAAFHSAMLLSWYQMTVCARQWSSFVLFDSPIFSVPERTLNQGSLGRDQLRSMTLLQNSLCDLVAPSLTFDNIHVPGIIGYAVENQLPWYSARFKGHPGSLIHFEFFRHVMLPRLRELFDCCLLDVDEYHAEAEKYQKLFDQTAG